MTSCRWFVDPSAVTARWLFSHLLTVFVVCPTSMMTDAACGVDQTAACKTAAGSGQLSEYRASGECIVKQYVQFTHVCTVSDYLPSIDHCCCMLNDDALMCCRYHQDWYHFRCVETDDQIPLNDAHWIARWQFLVPVTLCPVAFIALVICLCCRYAKRRHTQPEPDMTSSRVCWSCSHIFGAGSKKRRVTVTGSNMTYPTYPEPSAPPMTSLSDYDVTPSRRLTCGPETASSSSAPLCQRCGAVVPSPGDVIELPPPSYELSQRLQITANLT